MTTPSLPLAAFNAPRARMTGAWVPAVVALALAASLQPIADAATAPAPNAALPAVTVMTVQLEDVVQDAQFVGRVEAIQQVDMRARVQGFLQDVAFTEGQDVKINDPLFTIERDQYEAALLQANAQQASAEATLRNAQLTLDRRQELYQRQAGTRADLDQAIASRDAAEAAVDSAKAGVRTAQLNLSYTRITAPISGRIGRANVTKGNVVGPDSGALARVVQLDPIRIVFSVSERDFVNVIQQGHETAVENIGAAFVPTLRLPNGTPYAEQGRIDFIANEIDQATGTVPVRASFANPEGLLLPGGTVSVTVRTAQTKRMPLVPAQAVLETREGRFVLVVGDGDRVERRPIKATQQVGQSFAVEDGLKPGETVIVEGLQKVREGAQVQPLSAPLAETR